MFEDFDFNVLDDPDFKEDSVREELILPIIRSLGYSLTGDARVIRSKSLEHPFVSIGSKRNKISIIPDYLFTADGKPFWILDAKSPTENIRKSKHVEQAYSYAIHPEVRADLFALCNGHEFVLYSVKKLEPILSFELSRIQDCFESLSRILHPEIKANPELLDYAPDYGLHLHRLGVEPGFTFIGMAIHTNFVSKVQDGMYTSGTLVESDGVQRYASFDFTSEQLEQLLKFLPEEQANKLNLALTRQPYMLALENEELLFGVCAKLTEKIMHNAEETYLPFQVEEFMAYKGFKP